ncbi:lipopolysaccharide biosynthesis protein [Micromonospora sp. ALFpr18c]|uniref:lipopolysaccharide biosynthesis protein n=1 Tax=Micromonospora sp. ALFpr18c TaxID=1458665 RepID=UPI00124B7B5A|nr:lipopolysaccharide biosynthesis protein [Micromonospora sp. ALFpr18c]KAB1940657.1 lipopolysaccharide biosynthesis protein [Micromonospora sp. ALFpr18c]
MVARHRAAGGARGGSVVGRHRARAGVPEGHAVGQHGTRSVVPSDAGKSRGQILARGIVSSLAGKMVGLAAPLLITPLAFRSLGAERYGLWMAVTSLTSMALFADFGLGNGLLTRLARLHGTGERRAAAREISSAYAILGALSVLLLVVLVGTLRWVPWPTLLSAADPAVAGDARPVVLLCFGAFLVNIPFALIQRVQYAQQQVTQSNLWQAGGSLVSVALVYAAVTSEADPVLVIAAAVLAVPLVSLANSVCYFGWQARELRPRPGLVRAPVARGLLRLGTRFFLLSLLTSVVLNLDNVLISRVLGLPAAATYAVVVRMFALLTLFVTLVNMPLWAANGEALARGDLAWVRRTTVRMVALSATVVALPGGALVVFGNDVIRVWVRTADFPSVPRTLLVGLAAWSLLLAVVAPLFMVQNSIGLLRPQFVGWAACLAVAVPLKIVLAQRVGLPGVALASAATYALTVLPAAVIGYRRVLVGETPSAPPASEGRVVAAVGSAR